jgi:hypothetical protein
MGESRWSCAAVAVAAHALLAMPTRPPRPSQVELVGEGAPDALSLHLWTGEIPIDRHAELKATQAAGGIWSVTLNAVELRTLLSEGASNSSSGRRRGLGVIERQRAVARRLTSHDLTPRVRVAVKGGPFAQRFKMLATVIPARIGAVLERGEICPGQILYHMAPPGLTDARFTFVKHEGDGAVLARSAADSSAIPLRLSPPYVSLATASVGGSVDVCGMSAGDTAYLAVFGGARCMEYEVRADGLEAEHCHPPHGGGGDDAESRATAVVPGHFVYGSCGANSWADYSLALSASEASVNFIVEVEDLANGRSSDP